jgi:hypothetical protein
MEYLHQDLGVLGPDEVVEVTLDHPANVQLLDALNFGHYENRRPFQYHGGHATSSPIELRPPSLDHWHLVIDLGGGPGTVRAGVRVYPEPAPVHQ